MHTIYIFFFLIIMNVLFLFWRRHISYLSSINTQNMENLNKVSGILLLRQNCLLVSKKRCVDLLRIRYGYVHKSYSFMKRLESCDFILSETNDTFLILFYQQLKIYFQKCNLKQWIEKLFFSISNDKKLVHISI